MISKILINRSVLVMFVAVFVMACEAKIGSERWCENMSEKPKGDWTFNETADYAKHCILPKKE